MLLLVPEEALSLSPILTVHLRTMSLQTDQEVMARKKQHLQNLKSQK